MTLQELNEAGESSARAALLECCGCMSWADQMLTSRPFKSREAVLAVAEESWWRLEPEDWLEAFAAHPKIGAQKLSEWCSQEQSGVLSEPDEILRGLAEGNDRYQQQFGWIFLVNASGKSGGQLLERLHSRLANSPEQELRIAAGEQTQITALRLNRLLQA